MNKPACGLSCKKKSKQLGVAIVEFAFISTILFTLLIGIMEFGRLLFTWNWTTEATRWGARLAIVCNINSDGIKTKIHEKFPILATDDITVTYLPSSCSGPSNCQGVTVEISPNAQSYMYLIPHWTDKNSNGKFDLIGDWEIGWGFKIPSFTTTLPRESLSNESGSDINPDCPA